MKPQIGLALSGGNALGAYAAGAYAALHRAGMEPQVISGASIGAVTATLIAGNPPERRVARLEEFWRQAAAPSIYGGGVPNGWMRDLYNKLQATQALMVGRPGLFRPRPSGFLSLLPGTPPDVGLFDPLPLVGTLERLVDFDYLNQQGPAVVLTCVDLLDGSPVYFDSRKQVIEPRHVLASTAFIPGFPPARIDGRLLGDPGMQANLPLDPLLDAPSGDLTCFAVDLFDSVGQAPTSMDTALERAQDILFSAQSLRTIAAVRKARRLQRSLAEVKSRLAAQAIDLNSLAPWLDDVQVHELELVLIAYRAPVHELGAKAMEFSARSIGERWQAGEADMDRALALHQAGEATTDDPGFRFYDGRRRDPRTETTGANDASAS
ncbi:MAG: patatin-like phospholipase family protein [Aquincola tertiaricarbonis]